MNQAEHLTEKQLTDYFGDPSLKGEAKHRIGRHLLQCDFCLKRLPQPTIANFWAALMTDEAEDETFDERTVWAARLASIFQSLKQPKILALSAAALAILMFFFAFVWLGAVKSSETENVIAANIESASPVIEPARPVFDQTGDEQTNSPSDLPVAKNGDSSSPATMARIIARRESPVGNNARKYDPKSASRNNSNLETANSEKASVSSTRGGSTDLPYCGGEVGMTTVTNGEAVTLKWKKIPKAAKYHLYVSDEEEILLDEFETSQATSYVLKKPLDPQKTYKWKVVVTLENGDTVIGDSRKFKVKDLRLNQKKSEKKEKSEIRCSESK